METDLYGECLCRAVRYTVPDEFQYALYCHCSQCRRATGSAFKPLAGIPRSKLRLLNGQDGLLIHGDEASAHDVHCVRCGSLLFSVVRDGEYAHVAMGSLIDKPSIVPSMHIHTASKAPWHQITDNLPQHAQLPPE